jgi:hypothetical protein
MNASDTNWLLNVNINMIGWEDPETEKEHEVKPKEIKI